MRFLTLSVVVGALICASAFANESAPKKVKVAAIRILYGHNHNVPMDELLKKALAMTNEAADMGAKYISLPESILTSTDSADTTVPGPLINPFVELAKKRNVYLCVGIVETEPSTVREGQHDRWISAVLIGPDGILGKHRKVNIVQSHLSTNNETGIPRTDRFAFPGNDYAVHPFGEVKRLGVLICRDSFTNYAWARLLCQDPQMIFHPNLRSSITQYGADLPAMARKYGVPIVAADGHEESESMIVDRDGTILDIEKDKERVLFAEVTLADDHPQYVNFEVILNHR